MDLSWVKWDLILPGSFGVVLGGYLNHQTVCDFHIRIDATGQAIVSPSKPFSKTMKYLFYDVGTIYKRLSLEVRSGKLKSTDEDPAPASQVSIIENEFARPAIFAQKVSVRLGDKTEGFPIPAGIIANSSIHNSSLS